MSKSNRRRFNVSSKRSPMRGYKSKTQVIAKNEAKAVVRANMSRMIEKKRWDAQDVYQQLSTTATIRSLFTDPLGAASFSTGTGGQSSVGDVITPIYIYVRLAVSIVSTANSIIRVVILQSRGPWAGPVGGDVFQSTAGGGVLSEFNQENIVGKSGRFRILADRHYVVTSASAPQLMFRTIKIRRDKLIKVKFDSGAPNAITDGNLWIVAVTDQTTPSLPEWKYYSAITFKDA